MHWTEDAFWNSTHYTLSCAWIGHCQANRIGRFKEDKNGFSAAGISEHRRIVQEMMDRYPDRPKRMGKRKRGAVNV